MNVLYVHNHYTYWICISMNRKSRLFAKPFPDIVPSIYSKRVYIFHSSDVSVIYIGYDIYKIEGMKKKKTKQNKQQTREKMHINNIVFIWVLFEWYLCYCIEIKDHLSLHNNNNKQQKRYITHCKCFEVYFYLYFYSLENVWEGHIQIIIHFCPYSFHWNENI